MGKKQNANKPERMTINQPTHPKEPVRSAAQREGDNSVCLTYYESYEQGFNCKLSFDCEEQLTCDKQH